MKTKLLLSVVVLFTFFGTAFSQQYRPFLNNSSWLINDWVACCQPAEVREIPEGTAMVIGAFTYTQFDDPFPQQDSNGNLITVISVREDVAQQKVYKLVNGTDMLLYDFSLENGDIISQYGYTFTATVDAVTVNGGTRKRITLRSAELYHDETLTQTWIEGVGSTAHPFYPDSNMYNVASSGGGFQIRTRCSFQNGAHVYGNPNCAAVALSTSAEDFAAQKIVFSPNPFITEFTIDSDSILQNASLRIYNTKGQLIREIQALNGTKITVSRQNLNSGLYLGQLFENGQLLKSVKMLVN